MFFSKSLFFLFCCFLSLSLHQFLPHPLLLPLLHYSSSLFLFPRFSLILPCPPATSPVLSSSSPAPLSHTSFTSLPYFPHLTFHTSLAARPCPSLFLPLPFPTLTCLALPGFVRVSEWAGVNPCFIVCVGTGGALSFFVCAFWGGVFQHPSFIR